MRKIFTITLIYIKESKRLCFVLTLATFSLSSYGQTKNEILIIDTLKVFDTITVNYANKEMMLNKGKPEYYINNIFFGNNLPIMDMVPNDVMDVNIYGNKIKISSIKNIGGLELISLKELSEAYFKPSNGSIIFMLNGEFLKDDLNNYKIDKKYVLSIDIIDKNNFKYLRAMPQNFKIVNIKTRTKENIKAARTIYIR